LEDIRVNGSRILTQFKRNRKRIINLALQTKVKCLLREAVGKRLLGRHKRRWEKNTKTIVKEIERKELIWLLIRNNSIVREKS
jgi:hypothetical protein